MATVRSSPRGWFTFANATLLRCSSSSDTNLARGPAPFTDVGFWAGHRPRFGGGGRFEFRSSSHYRSWWATKPTTPDGPRAPHLLPGKHVSADPLIPENPRKALLTSSSWTLGPWPRCLRHRLPRSPQDRQVSTRNTGSRLNSNPDLLGRGLFKYGCSWLHQQDGAGSDPNDCTQAFLFRDVLLFTLESNFWRPWMAIVPPAQHTDSRWLESRSAEQWPQCCGGGAEMPAVDFASRPYRAVRNLAGDG